MALYLVGENLDKHRAHSAAQAGDLINLHRGIYVDARDDIDRTVVQHAIRIAAYLYPKTFLSGASAARLAPTDDGRLYLSGRRNLRTRIRTLEIIQNQAPSSPSTVPVIIGDDIGEISFRASSPHQRFLEAFRQRSEHSNAIDPGLRREMAARLIEEYGNPAEAADALWTLGRSNGWIREAEAAEKYLTTDMPEAPVNQANLDLAVAWHGDGIGRLFHDGAEWRWHPAPEYRPNPIRETRPGSLPPFIESLLPEGWLAQILHERDERDMLRSGGRYMSNIAIVTDPERLATFPADQLGGRLANFQDQGLFTGRYRGPVKRHFDDNFQARLARLYASNHTPRLSGVQIKAPMYLQEDGDLIPASDAPFTHILKPAGTNGFETIAIVEWISLTLARSARFNVPEIALINMPNKMAPALLVERFDIRRSPNDTQRIALEDMCSVLDLPASRKYDGTIERIARSMRPLSTDPVTDIEYLFQRALFAWLIGDGDMHLKNLGLRKIAEAGAHNFGEVRMSPVYDAVTTKVFPGLEHDRMAFLLNGKNERLTPADFFNAARTIEITQTRAGVLLAECARHVVNAVPTIELPEPFAVQGAAMLRQIQHIVERRAEPFL